MLSATHRHGLTRLETSVLIGIIVLAVGLLLPVLPQVQAAASGVACQRNLAIMAIGALNYESVNGRLPPGMDNQYVGTLIHILPYIEQDILHRNFSFDRKYSLYWENPHNRPATDGTDDVPRPPDVYGCEWDVLAYQCPDGPLPEDTVTALMAVRYGTPGVDYRANDKLHDGHLFSGSPGRHIMARSHYLGIGGDWRTEAPYSGRYRGIFTWNSQVSIPQIVDGTSNTIAFAETWGGYVPWNKASGIPSGWSVPSRSAGFNWSTFGTCPNLENPNCDFKDPYNSGLSITTFGAYHSKSFDRFYFALADGSVRSFPGNVNFNLWMAMCGYRDGEILPRGLEPAVGWAWND